MTTFEVVSSKVHDQHAEYEVSLDEFLFHVERHHDWLTTAYWSLPDEYTYVDFLRVVEQMFTEAEANGYVPDDEHTYAMGSSKLKRVVEGEFIRPLELGDFEEFGVKDEEIGFLRVGDDLAHFYFSQDGIVAIILEEKPHQTRSGFSFMANLFPSRLRLEPAEIGEFVLGLQRP